MTELFPFKPGRVMLTVALSGATIYDISGRIDVNKGETFTLSLEGYHGKLHWFAHNDPVLEIKESDDTKSATIKALQTGVSQIEIQVQDSEQVVRKAKITVRPAQADRFDVAQDKPEKK